MLEVDHHPVDEWQDWEWVSLSMNHEFRERGVCLPECENLKTLPGRWEVGRVIDNFRSHKAWVQPDVGDQDATLSDLSQREKRAFL
jgi:hypothetical protein